MVEKKCIYPESAPIPAGPYSPALQIGNLLFVSGQTPEKPGTDELVVGGIREQTKQVMENINNIISAAGCSMEHVVKVNTHLLDISDFDDFNDVYRSYFKEPFPARTTVQSVIPGGSLIEVDVIAVILENNQ
jgi:2-iminobutanoate/2-iminopropanoate deaminase